ncbi:MAG: hypothetical protein AB7V62_15065 [Thermoleophilia bacterium]
MAAAAAASALLLAGCGGGGGGGGDEQGDLPAADSAIPVASGVAPQDSALQAIAALGTPGPVDATGSGQTLSGFDTFGTPHDAFEQQVDTQQGGDEPGTAPAIPADTPINGDPLVAVPAAPATPDPTTTDPGAGAEVQNPIALEADFDISGEPVVAREGDAIPPDTQQFIVQSMTQTSVTLELSGGLLPDGTDTVELEEGESITLYNATAQRSYKIKLVDVRRV